MLIRNTVGYNLLFMVVGVILQVTPELSQGGQLINLHLHPQVVSDPTWKNYGMRIPKSSNSTASSSRKTRDACRAQAFRFPSSAVNGRR